MPKLQEVKGQFTVTIPVNAIQGLKWGKGDELWVSADPTSSYLIIRKLEKE